MEGLEYIFAADGKLLGHVGDKDNQMILVTSPDNYKAFKSNRISLGELVNQRSVSVLKMPDYVKSNIATTVYRKVRNRAATYNLYNGKITVGQYNVPPVYEWAKENEYTAGKRQGDAQTIHNPFPDENESAILIYKFNDNYAELAFALQHEDLHAYLKHDKNVISRGVYELRVYMGLLKSPFLDKLGKSKNGELDQFKDSYKSYLTKILERFSRNKATIQEINLYKKAKKAYEKRFNVKLGTFEGTNVVIEKKTKNIDKDNE